MIEIDELFAWAASIFALAMVAMGIRQSFIANKLSGVCDVVELIKTMHDHPDDYGFGTKMTNELIKETAKIQKLNAKELAETRRAIDDLIHVLKFDIEERTGKKVPPRLPGG